jgi:hypothetical protein
MSIIDKIRFAFQVMLSWEVLVTLGGFIALWLLLRYVADPWSRVTHSRPSPRPPVSHEHPAGKPPVHHDGDIDEFPD